MTLRYWYILPIAALIATVATTSGVGGATLFTPLLILALHISPEVAVGVGLVSEVFGFASAFYTYAHKRLIDYRLGVTLLTITVPVAVLGTLLADFVEPEILKAILGVGLFAVAVRSLGAPAEEHDRERREPLGSETSTAVEHERGEAREETCLVTSEGEKICYTVCNRTVGRLIAAVGALFKGMIATGLGELNEDFLLEYCHVPSRVSVATGVFVILFTSLSAAAAHLVSFALGGGQELATALSLIIFTIPGVIVGGQLGPWILSHLPPRALERELHILLLLFAVLTLVEAVLG